VQCNSEKMDAISELKFRLANQTGVCLVDEGCGLQRVVTPFRAELRRGDPPEIAIKPFNEQRLSVRVSPVAPLNKDGNRARWAPVSVSKRHHRGANGNIVLLYMPDFNPSRSIRKAPRRKTYFFRRSTSWDIASEIHS